MPQYLDDSGNPIDPQKLIRQSAKKYGADPELLRATAKVESNFNPRAVSSKGAQGMMQLMPRTARSLGVKDPFDIAQSIEGAAKLHGQLNVKYKGDRAKIAAAYNAGEPAVDKAGGVPNFPETQDYVKKINSEYQPSVKYLDEDGEPLNSPSKRLSLDEIISSKRTGATGVIGGAIEAALPTTRALDVPEGISYAVQHPLDAAGLVGGSLLQAHLDQFKQSGQLAGEAVQEPNWSDKILTGFKALGHGLAGAVPMVGPAVAQGAERIGGPETARGVGNILGVAAPIVMGKAAENVLPEKPVGRVPLTRSERTGSAPMKLVESAVERSIMGSGPFKKFRERQQTALSQWSDDLTNQVSDFRGSHEELGNLLHKNVEATHKAMKEDLRQQYAEADRITNVKEKRITTTTEGVSQAGLVDEFGQPAKVPIQVKSKVFVGGIQPATQPLKRIAAPMLRDLQRQELIMDKTQLATYKADLQAIIKSPATVPFQTMQDFRSDMLAIARSLDEPIPGKRAGLARALSAAADKSMEVAAANSKNPEVMSIIRNANAGYKYMAETFNESLVNKLINKAPEKAHLLLKTGDFEGIRRIKASVTPENWQAMKSHLIQDMLNDATKNEITSALAPSSVTGVAHVIGERKVLMGKTLTDSLEKLGSERMGQIFNQAEVKEFSELAKTAKKVQEKPGQAVWSWVLNVPLIYAGGRMTGALFGAPSADIAPALGLAGATNLLARVMTKPEGIRTVRHMIHSMDNPKGQAAVFYGTKLSQLMQNEAELERKSQRGVGRIPEPPESMQQAP